MRDVRPPPLRRAHPGSHPRRAGIRRHPRRRPAARAEQLREPRLPGLARGRRPAGGRQVLPAAALERRRDRSRSTRSRWNSTSAKFPVVAPLVIDGRTLHEHAGFRFAVYPRRGGRSPELDRPDVLERIGRFIGRHARRRQRRRFVASTGARHRELRRRAARVPARAATSCRPTLVDVVRSVVAQALDGGTPRLRPSRRAGVMLRLHGDCHAGNVLWTDDGPHFVDFDDARIGPAVQDLWMLLSGDARRDGRRSCDTSSTATRSFSTSTAASCALIEPLRTLRLIHYSAWIARRWDDPAFPAALSVVQHAALLAGPDPRVARADRADGRAAAGGVAPRGSGDGPQTRSRMGR